MGNGCCYNRWALGTRIDIFGWSDPIFLNTITDGISQMEYDLPIVGPINQERVIEYGKNNLGNLGPVLSILCLVVFMLTMVLTWLYLFCCSLCCHKKKPKLNAHVQSPSTSRPLSMRSDVPLRPKSASPRVLEDDPTDPAFTGVSAYDRVDAISRQNEEAAARAANKKTYSFKRFYTCSSILCGLSTICAAGVYLYQSKFDVSIKNLVIDAEDLTLDTAQFLCTSERSSECRGRGVGHFVQKAQTKATRLLGDISTFLGTIDDILPSINATIDTLEGSKGDLQRIKLYAAMINSNVTAINQYKTWLLNPSLAGGADLSANFPSGNLPNISSEQLSFVNSGVSSVDQAVGSARAVYANVNGVVTGQVASTISSLDPSTGSVAQGMLEPLGEMLSQLIQLRNQTLFYYHTVHDNAAFYGQYLQQKTLALTLLFFLPVIFQVLFMLCNVCKARRCKGCSFHLTLNMCVSCICVVFFLLFTLVFSLLATLSATVCDYHVLALQQAPTMNISLGTSNVVFDSTTIESVLNCPSGLNATDDNNFISILGLHQLFNVSKQVASATSDIRAAKASFSPDTQLESAMSQLNGMSNSTTFNVSETAPVSVFKNQLHSLQATLPDSDPDLDQATQQTKLQDNYLTNSWGTWSGYQNAIDDLNDILVEVTNIPAGFFKVYTFDMMHNFTLATVEAEPAWAAEFPTSPSATTYNDFKTKLTAADQYTIPVNVAVSANVVVQRNLTLVDAHLDKISTVVDRIGDTQASLANLKTNVNASLSATLVQANGVLKGLDAQVDKVETLPAFIVTAPEYARCGFVGDFYENGFVEGFCGEFKTSVATMWPFMLAAAVSLYVSFMVFACHVRKPVWFLYPQEDGIELPGLSVASPRSARPAAIVA